MSDRRLLVETQMELTPDEIGLSTLYERVSELRADGDELIDPNKAVSDVVRVVGYHIDEAFSHAEGSAVTVLVSRGSVSESLLALTLAAQADVWGLKSINVETRATSTLMNH